jgi:hypothetical protein
MYKIHHIFNSIRNFHEQNTSNKELKKKKIHQKNEIKSKVYKSKDKKKKKGKEIVRHKRLYETTTLHY